MTDIKLKMAVIKFNIGWNKYIITIENSFSRIHSASICIHLGSWDCAWNRQRLILWLVYSEFQINVWHVHESSSDIYWAHLCCCLYCWINFHFIGNCCCCSWMCCMSHARCTMTMTLCSECLICRIFWNFDIPWARKIPWV